MRILIVEDDPAAARLLGALLATYGACQIAVDGPSALEALRAALDQRAPYRLVCLDIQLGDMDGHDVLRALRAEESSHGLDVDTRARVVMTTAVSDPAKMLATFYDLCDAYLVKPIRRARLVETLSRLGIEAPTPGL